MIRYVSNIDLLLNDNMHIYSTSNRVLEVALTLQGSKDAMLELLFPIEYNKKYVLKLTDVASNKEQFITVYRRDGMLKRFDVVDSDPLKDF